MDKNCLTISHLVGGKWYSNKKWGFTLIEILIALSILVIVVVSSYTVLRGIADSWLKGEARTERYKNARVILGIMSREISQAMVNLQPVYCLGYADKVFFIFPIGRSEAQSDLVEVGYWLRTTDNALVRHYQANPDYNFETADSIDELGENISQVEFKYYDGLSWKESWDSRLEGSESNQLPKAMKIKLTLGDEKGIKAETFETIIHLATSE